MLRSALLLVVLAAAGVLTAIWIVDYLPTHDGPQHVFLGHLANHFEDPGAGYGDYLTHGQPFTALGFDLIFSTLERALSWRSALRVTLSVIALVWGFGACALAASLHPQRAAIGLLGFATAISWSVYMGFFSYALSVGLAFVVLAAALRDFPWTPIRRLGIVALLAVTAVAHAFGAELAGLVLVALIAVRGRESPRGTLRELGLLALMGLPAVLIALTATSPITGETLWLSFSQKLSVLPRTFLPGPAWRAWASIVLSVAGLAWAAARLRRDELRRPEVALFAGALLCLGLSVLLPMHLRNWEFCAPRFLPLAILGGAVLLPIERLDARGRAGATAAIAIFTAASIAVAILTSMRLRASMDEPLAGLSQPVQRKGPRLAFVIDLAGGPGDNHETGLADQDIPYFEPVRNLGALYAVEQGGIPPYVFTTSPRLHSFVFSPEGRSRYPALFDPLDLRDPAIETDPGRRRALLTFIAALGASFEDVVMWGRREDGDTLRDHGYAEDFRRGGLFIGRFEGCPMRIEVMAPAPRAVAVLIEHGFDPLPQPVTWAALPPTNAPGQEPARITPRVPLCGPAWLRVALDLDRSGTPSAKDAFCAGADANGKLHFDARKGLVVECRLPAAP